MKPRWLLTASLLAIFFLSVSLIFAMLLQTNSVDANSFNRLKEGMTKAEVVDVFRSLPKRSTNAANILEWSGNSGQAVLIFDSDGLLKHKVWVPTPPESYGQQIKRLLQRTGDSIDMLLDQ